VWMSRKTFLKTLLCLMLFALPATGEEEQAPGYKVGQQALDFTLQDLEGQDVKLSDQRGKVVVLTFWDWGCVECREKSIPQLQKSVMNQYGPDLVSIFAINVEPNPDIERIKGFAQEKGISYPILLQGMQLAFDYRVYAIPILLVIDQEGIIRYREQKSLESAALEMIDDLVEVVVQGEQLGSEAIDFTLQDLEGNDVALSDHEGKIIVLTFWRSNQPDCWEALVGLQSQIYQEFTLQQVALLSINTDASPNLEQINTSKTERQLSFPILVDGAQVASAYKVFAAPVWIVIDQSGVIRYRAPQMVDEELLAAIRALLA